MTSVVIPALDDAAALCANLPRWAALPGADELIVADGGGNEAAHAAAAAVGARLVRCRPGRGPQLNAGAAAAAGDRLLFLHADCWLDEGALREAGAALDDPGVGAVIFRQQIEGERAAYRWIERHASWRARVRRCPYGDSGLYLRRRDFERAGGYPDLPLCEDLALAPRLAALGRIVETTSRIHLSARRWEQHGIVWTSVLNWLIAGAFRIGVAPAKLYRIYYGRAPAKGPGASAVEGERVSRE